MGYTITMETEEYSRYVSNMKKESAALLGAGEQPVVPDDVVVKNVVIPDYVTANEETLDTIRRLQAIFVTTNKLMVNIQENYEKQVDENMSNQLDDANGTSSSGG